MSRSRFPRATTDPLAEDAQSSTGGKRNSIGVEGDIEDVELQKGMPARNLRNIGIGVLAVGLVAFLLWPTKPFIKPTDVPNAPASDLVKGLVDDLQNPRRPVTLPEFEEQKASGPVVAAEPEVDERIQLALLSPMAATEVELGNVTQRQRTSDSRSAVSLGQDAQLEAKQQAYEQQARLVESLAAAAGGPAPVGAGGLVSAAGPSAGAPLTGDPRDAHKQFLAQNRGNGSVGEADTLHAARIGPTLYEGTLIRTVLTRALNSDLPGTITAKVSADLYDSVTQNTLLVPRGSEVICNYDANLLVGQEVILAACTRLRLPNGRSFALNGTPASSESGATGLPADIDNHFLKMFGSALVVGAVSYLMPSNDRNITIATGADGSRESGGTIFGSALQQVVQSTIARNIRIPPTGTVDIGTPFTLTLTRDVEMEPYLPSQRRGAR